MQKIHLDILDKKRVEILNLLGFTKDQFYLAGGTALALQIGHRDSIDFDFFSEKEFDVAILKIKIERAYAGKKIVFGKDTEWTLLLEVDGVSMSFFYHPYKIIKKFIELDTINMVGLEDISAMKMNAVSGRGKLKDFVDIFYLLNFFSLQEMFAFSGEKYPTLDPALILKGLTYFEGVDPKEKIYFKVNLDFKNKFDWGKFQVDLTRETRKIFV